MKRIIWSCVGLAFGVLMVVGSTFALFDDRVTCGGKTMTEGDVCVKEKNGTVVSESNLEESKTDGQIGKIVGIGFGVLIVVIGAQNLRIGLRNRKAGPGPAHPALGHPGPAQPAFTQPAMNQAAGPWNQPPQAPQSWQQQPYQPEHYQPQHQPEQAYQPQQPNYQQPPQHDWQQHQQQAPHPQPPPQQQYPPSGQGQPWR